MTTRAAQEEQFAQDYAESIRRADAGEVIDWTYKNLDIVQTLSMTALIRIKRRAWFIVSPTTRAAAETAVDPSAGETSRPQREGPDGSETPGTTRTSSRS